MQVTYQQLLDGYILEVGDSLKNIHGFTSYVVACNAEGKYVLCNTDGEDCAIYDWVHKSYVKKPFYLTLKMLTAAVKDLYQRSHYKVGDKVIITAATRKEDDYPWIFTKKMQNMVGRVFTIEEIEEVLPTAPSAYNSDFDGDYHKYRLSGDAEDYAWHSSEFKHAEPAIDSKAFTEVDYDIDAVPDDIKPNSFVKINDEEYRIGYQTEKGYYLVGGHRIFQELGIKEKYEWMYNHGFTERFDVGGSFPWVKTREKLWKCICLFRKMYEMKNMTINVTDSSIKNLQEAILLSVRTPSQIFKDNKTTKVIGLTRPQSHIKKLKIKL